MPREDYYSGLPLADAIEHFANFHSDPDTRHISHYEVALLLDAAERLRMAGGDQLE